MRGYCAVAGREAPVTAVLRATRGGREFRRVTAARLPHGSRQMRATQELADRYPSVEPPRGDGSATHDHLFDRGQIFELVLGESVRAAIIGRHSEFGLSGGMLAQSFLIINENHYHYRSRLRPHLATGPIVCRQVSGWQSSFAPFKTLMVGQVSPPHASVPRRRDRYSGSLGRMPTLPGGSFRVSDTKALPKSVPSTDVWLIEADFELVRLHSGQESALVGESFDVGMTRSRCTCK